MTARTDMTDRVLAATDDGYCQLHLTHRDDIEMAMVFALPVDVLALFDHPPPAGGDNFFYRTGLDVFKKNGLAQVLYLRVIVLHKAQRIPG